MTGNTRVTAQAAKGIFLSAAVGDALGWPQEARGGLLGGQKERDRARGTSQNCNNAQRSGGY